MRHQRECLIAFLCLGITIASSASRREELERAAELAVEKAAERAAERAVEKALDGGNSTTESKLVSESYTHVKKNPDKEKKEDDFNDGPGYEPIIDDDVESEEDVDEWSGYSQQSAFAPPYVSDLDFHAWSKKVHLGDLSSTWRRFPRSELPREQANWIAKPREKKIVTVEKKVPVSAPVEKKIPVYKHVPYEVKVPISQPYAEKRVPYPIKVYVNVPVDVPESYQVERQVSYAVNFDNPVPYKVEVPAPQPYTFNRPTPHEVKVPIKVPTPYEIEKKLPVPVKVVDRPYPLVPMSKPYPEVARPYSVEVSKPYPVRIKLPVDKPYLVPIERPMPISVKVPDPQTYLAEKPYPVPIKVPVNKPYEVHETKPVLVSVRKPFPYFAQVPVPAKLNWRIRNSIGDKEDQLGSESAQFLRLPWPARDSFNR